MNVGILSYPMLFQNDGGLQIQIRETIKYLTAIGVDATLIDVNRQNLANFDVIHVFAAIHGNDKLVDMAKAKGKKVVLSPIINPSLIPPSTFSLLSVQMLERAIARLSNWTVTTNHQMVKKALMRADHLLALSASEKSILMKTYGVSQKRISIVPNGVSPHFFQADKDVFLSKYGIHTPFVFCPALISPWKNQKSLVQAMAGTGVKVVLAGAVRDGDQPYLQECLNWPEAEVIHVGNLERDSPTFSSCYAAASVVVLPSQGESGPLVAVESLAAGTPALITRKNGLDLKPDGKCFTTVAAYDISGIRASVLHIIQNLPSAQECRQIVRHLSWEKIAKDIAAVYAGEMSQ